MVTEAPSSLVSPATDGAGSGTGRSSEPCSCRSRNSAIIRPFDTGCRCDSRLDLVQSCAWHQGDVILLGESRSIRVLVPPRAGELISMRGNSPCGATAASGCLLTPPYGPCGILQYDNCEKETTDKWKCAVSRAVKYASSVYYTAQRYLMHIQQQPLSVRSKLWKLNSSWVFVETPNSDPWEINASLEFWFGPYSAERAKSILKVVDKATRLALGIDGNLLTYTCDYTQHPLMSSKEKLSTCAAWGSKYGSTIYQCVDWASDDKFNDVMRWSNMVHEYTHVGGAGHCIGGCPYGVAWDNPALFQCDNRATFLQIKNAQDWQYLLVNTYPYTLWLYYFALALEDGLCVPTTVLGRTV